MERERGEQPPPSATQPPAFLERDRLRAVLRKQELREDRAERLAEDGSTTNHDFRGTAAELGIPTEHLDHPAVRSFVRVYNELLQLRADIPDLATAAIPPEHKQLNLGAVDGAIHLGPALFERYAAIDLLTRTALSILGEGMPRSTDPGLRRPINRDLVRHDLNAAIRRYGLVVIEQNGPTQDDGGSSSRR